MNKTVMIDVWFLWMGLNSESKTSCPDRELTLEVITVVADLQNINESCTQPFIKCPSHSMDL